MTTLTGPRLLDDHGRQLAFPTFALPAGSTVAVLSGAGTKTAGDVYTRWNTAAWNNDGDTAT